jgi:WD40 repeat protein/predicted Ser/Thr protein kinase
MSATPPKIGKFELLAELGKGGMGVVYEALDPNLDRRVALKTIAAALLSSGETMERFKREARAAAKLQHPNIVTIYELGEDEGTLYIAMELLAGSDLSQVLSHPPLPSLARRLDVAIDVCRGLDYAHKNGVVHRDVKPANIRILPDDTVKIVDFGIARLGDSTMTQTGMVLGTPSYLAPEVLAGGRVDHRADMWAVGVVLYEMLAGKRPFSSPTFMSLAYKIVHEPLPPITEAAPSVPTDVAEVVNRALQKGPGDRFVDLAEMAAALSACVGRAAPGEPTLDLGTRELRFRQHLEAARARLRGSDLEGALQAARQAQALWPSRTDVVSLLGEIEGRLEAPHAPPPAGATMVVATEDLHPATPLPPPGPLPLPAGAATPVGTTTIITALKTRGAAVFRELATFGEPPGCGTAVLSPRASLLATAGTDGAIRLVDLEARRRVAILRTEMYKRAGHDARATVLAFTADGRCLASGHVDGTIRLWKVAAAEEIPVKLRHDNAMVGALAFSPDARVLASGGTDSVLKLWDVRGFAGKEARRELIRQPAGVTALAYAEEGRTLVTGLANRVLRLLDTTNNRLTGTLRGAEAMVSLILPSPDGRRLAVTGQDRAIRLFDLSTRAQVGVVGNHRKPVTSLAFLPGSHYLASVALENVVQLWDVDSFTLVAGLYGGGDESFAAVVPFGHELLAVALADGRIRVWGPAA